MSVFRSRDDGQWWSTTFFYLTSTMDWWIINKANECDLPPKKFKCWLRKGKKNNRCRNRSSSVSWYHFLKNLFAEVLIQSFKCHELGLRVLPWLKWTCYNLCKQVEHDIHMSVVLNRTVAGSDWHFDNLCGSHLQSQSELYHISWWS